MMSQMLETKWLQTIMVIVDMINLNNLLQYA